THQTTPPGGSARAHSSAASTASSALSSSGSGPSTQARKTAGDSTFFSHSGTFAWAWRSEPIGAMLASWPEVAGAGAGRVVLPRTGPVKPSGPLGTVIHGDGTPGPGRGGPTTGPGWGSGPAPRAGPGAGEVLAGSL